MRPFLVALQFLTLVPIRLEPAPTLTELGRSLLWYPAVGLLIGLLVCAASQLLSSSPALLAAALVLTLWVIVTGALHLDGLADTADAWVGGSGDRERTLAIMKDPNAGPIAVATVVVVLLVKFAAIMALLQAGDWAGLILAPVLARTAMPVLFGSTPYVRAHGLGARYAAHLPRRAAIGVVLIVTIAIAASLRYKGLLAIVVAAAVLGLLRQSLLRRLGGFSGDCAGAAVELIETAVLSAAALDV